MILCSRRSWPPFSFWEHFACMHVISYCIVIVVCRIRRLRRSQWVCVYWWQRRVVLATAPVNIAVLTVVRDRSALVTINTHSPPTKSLVQVTSYNRTPLRHSQRASTDQRRLARCPLITSCAARWPPQYAPAPWPWLLTFWSWSRCGSRMWPGVPLCKVSSS